MNLTIVPPPAPETPDERPGLRLGPGLHLDVSHEDYLADPAVRPSLSSTIAKILVTRAPLHAQHAHPRLTPPDAEEDDEDDSTPAKDGGSILHQLLLGRGQEFVEIEFDNYRKKAAQEARDAARAAGRIPVLSRLLDGHRQAVEKLRPRLAARGVTLRGAAAGAKNAATELTAIWERDGILCRCRFDHWDGDELIIDDLKSCGDASPDELGRKFIEYGYDVSHSTYVEGAETLVEGAAGRVRMRFCFIESKAPYDVVIVEPDGTMRELGAKKWKRAKELWLRCTTDNKWPGYAEGVVRIGAPEWAVARYTESQMRRMENPSNDKSSIPF